MHWFEKILVGICSIIGLAFLYGFFVVVPVAVVNEPACLERGYPKINVTYNLKVYCANDKFAEPLGKVYGQ